MLTPDADDLRILNLLQHDARLNNKEIASRIGKSTTRVFERVKKLEEHGFIQRYVALLDPKLIGKSLTAYTQVHLNAHAAGIMQQFQQEIIKFPEVMECHHMTGQFDFLLKVALRDMDEYHDFMIHKLASLANVGTVQTFFVLNTAKKETAYTLLRQ